MKFNATQSFAFGAPDVIDALCDPGFVEHSATSKMGDASVLSCKRSATSITLKVRARFIADLPAAAHAIIDSDKLTWVETTIFDLDALSSSSTIAPDHYPDRLRASVDSTFENATGGCERSLTGNLSVKALLVAGLVERAIVSGLQEHLTEQAVLLDAYLAKLS